jgi:SAM-dependent methyltransferase
MESITAAQLIAGTIGVSIIRRWYVDGAFNEARLGELAEVIQRRDTFPYSLVLDPAEQELISGYGEWAESYDGPNPLIAAEEPVVQPILSALCGVGVRALDAACGTGRHAAFLAAHGCTTTGVDQSAAMLDRARAKVPDAEFHCADVRRMPCADESFDVAVVSLALCHLADPGEAVHELARVLSRRGTLVISDPHPGGSFVGGQAFYGGFGADRPMRWVRNHTHDASTWLRAFRGAGLSVVDCIEEPFGESQIVDNPVSLLYPDATRAALAGMPSLWVWVLQRDGDEK